MDPIAKGEMEAPAQGMKPAVVAVIVLCVLAVTIGIMYFMVIRPLKLKLAQVEGALDNATNLETTATTTPKGVLNNAGLTMAGRDRVIKIQEEQTPKGLITPAANEMFNNQLLKP